MEQNFSKTYKITTKDFWKNYWFYYKIHTICGIIALLLIVGSVYSCATRIDPDLTMMYIGESPLFLSEQMEYDVNSFLGKYVSDADGDGHCAVNLINLSMGDADPRVSQGSIYKFDIEVAEGNPFIILTDDMSMSRYKRMGAFMTIDAFVEKYSVPDDKIIRDGDGHALAVNVTGTDFGDIIGAGDRAIYAGIKILPERKMDEKDYMALHRESESFFEKLLAGEIVK